MFFSLQATMHQLQVITWKIFIPYISYVGYIKIIFSVVGKKTDEVALSGHRTVKTLLVIYEQNLKYQK